MSHQFGFRHEIVHTKTGTPFNREIPLRAEDFLNPQPGDVFQHGAFHDNECTRLHQMLRRLYRRNAAVTVLSHVKLVWPKPADFQPMPDFALVRDLTASRRARAMLDTAREGAAPFCIIEITSPLFADFDLVQKRRIYAAAGIPEYIILDTGLRPDHDTPRCTIHLLQLQDGAYVTAPTAAPATPSGAAPDAGAVYSPALRTHLRVIDNRFHLIDPQTGQPVQPDPDDAESESAAQAAGTFRAQSIASQLKL